MSETTCAMMGGINGREWLRAFDHQHAAGVTAQSVQATYSNVI